VWIIINGTVLLVIAFVVVAGMRQNRKTKPPERRKRY